MLCSHPKSCHWCFQHHLQYTRSANKYPINSSLNSRQLNLSPVFKKCQTVQGLLKTLLPTFDLNEPVQTHCSSSHERRMHLCETWGECLMLKRTLRILNEILLQGSLSSHWRVSAHLQPFYFFSGQTLSVHLYLRSVYTHSLFITRAL